MQYIIIALVALFLGFKLGRKYQDFQDLMLARRVSKLVIQREQLAKEQEDYERWERQDRRLGKLMERSEKEALLDD